MARKFDIRVEEKFVRHFTIEVPDEIEDVEGYAEALCNNAELDAVSGDCREGDTSSPCEFDRNIEVEEVKNELAVYVCASRV